MKRTTNKEKIYKFLNRNYELIFNDLKTYNIKSKSCFYQTFLYEEKFITEMDKIYPDDLYFSNKIILSWLSEEKDKLEKPIVNFYTKHKDKKNFSKLFNNCLLHFQNTGTHEESHIIYSITRIYFDKYVLPKIDKHIVKNKKLNCPALCVKVNQYFKNEEKSLTLKINEYIRNYYEKAIFNDKINEFFEDLDLSVGSLELQNKLVSTLKEDMSVFGGDVHKRLKDTYMTNYLKPKIDKYLSTLSIETVDTSNKLFKNFEGLEKESAEFYQICLDTLNDWYRNNFVDSNLKDILSQLVITLGPSNWKVTWIGHGPFDENRLVKVLDEHESNSSFIINYYKNWYKNAIIEASEKLMDRNHNF